MTFLGRCEIMPNMRDTNLLTVQAVADMAGVCRQTVYAAIKDGRMKCRLIGGHRFIRVEDARRFQPGIRGPRVNECHAG